MQTLFKIKLLQNLFVKNSFLCLKGWKLLVTMITLTILGVSTSFLALSQTNKYGGNKARLLEARNFIGALNRSQQAYYLENNSFSNSIEKLEIGIKTQTQNYTYSTKATSKAVFNYAVPRREYLSQGWFGLEKRPFYGFVGGVFVKSEKVGNKEEITTIAILCIAENQATTPPATPTYKNGVLSCGAGTNLIH